MPSRWGTMELNFRNGTAYHHSNNSQCPLYSRLNDTKSQAKSLPSRVENRTYAVHAATSFYWLRSRNGYFVHNVQYTNYFPTKHVVIEPVKYCGSLRRMKERKRGTATSSVEKFCCRRTSRRGWGINRKAAYETSRSLEKQIGICCIRKQSGLSHHSLQTSLSDWYHTSLTV
jgi:hypothetical protein